MSAPIRSVAMAFAVLLLLCIFYALAGLCEATPIPTVAVPESERPLLAWIRGDKSDEIGLFKDELRKLGYQIENEANESLTTLDDATMVALLKLCRDHGLQHSEYGIRKETWDAIMRGLIQPAVQATAVAQARRFLYYGDRGNDVLELQQRLKVLGYPFVMNPYALFDDEVLTAVEDFCQVNGIAYDRQTVGGITEALQITILSDKALPNPTKPPEAAPTEAPKPGLAEQFTTYMSTTISLGGLAIPNYALWIACVALAIGCILLIVHFFLPSEKKHEPTAYPGRLASMLAMGQAVSLEVKYQGNAQRYSIPVERSLRLGRINSDVELDPRDMRVSRQHCELYFQQGALMLRDYSNNGTLVNGVERKNCEHRLKSGDRLRIGDHEITVQF